MTCLRNWVFQRDKTASPPVEALNVRMARNSFFAEVQQPAHAPAASMQHQMLHVQVINRATRHNWRPHGVCISYGPRCSTLSFQSIGSSWIKVSALVASLTLRERRRVRLACSEARNVALQEELLKHGISFEDLDRPPHDPLLYPAS